MEPALQWLAHEGKATLETIALVVGLYVTAASFRADAKERRLSNLMALTGSHRDLWMEIDQRPDLSRLLKKEADLKANPVTASEKRFAHLLITHFAVSYVAVKSGLVSDMAGLRMDVKNFFTLPIPAEVWKWSREFQSRELVAFVDECLRGRRRARTWMSRLWSERR